MYRKLAFCLMLGIAVISCGVYGCGGDSSNVGCTGSIEPAVVVYVTDAATGAPAAAGATVIVMDDDYTETLTPTQFVQDDEGNLVPTAFSGAPERAGTYTVRVTRPGYAAAERTNIRADEDECHVDTQTITVALTPQ